MAVKDVRTICFGLAAGLIVGLSAFLWLTPACPPGHVNVADHGAIPSDGRDDTEALKRAAVASIKDSPLCIPRGSYNVVVGGRAVEWDSSVLREAVISPDGISDAPFLMER